MSVRAKALVLALTLIVTALLSACGGSQSPAPETAAPETGATAEAESTTAETKPQRSADLLPAADFKGADFVIVGREYAKLGNLPAIEFAVEELNGDVINDTIYNRNLTVSTNYNVKISAVIGAAQTLVRNSVTSGDGAYDLAWAHVNNMSALTLGGSLANYYDVPHVDLSKPWWNRLATEAMTLNGKCYLQMNYIPFTGVMLSHCLFYNVNMAKENNLTSPYDLIRDKKWSFDKFAELSSSVYRDVNGDGQRDAGDVYGLLCSHGTGGFGFAEGMGVRPVTIDAKGKVTLSLLTDRNQSVVEKIVSLTKDSSTWLITDYAKENDLAYMFRDGKGLFYSGFLTDAYQFFRDMNDDYGLLVFPTFEEGDDNYMTSVTGGTGLLGVPKVVSDMEKTGLVTEALAIESYIDVYPAVFETVVSKKLLRDETSQELFDLLMKGLEISFARTHKDAYCDIINTLVASGSTDLASQCASLAPAAEKHYAEVVEFYMKDNG